MIKALSIDELVRLHSKAQAKIDKMVEENQPLPEVVFEQFRCYHVSSSNGKKFYLVQFGVDTRDKENIQFWASCTCYGSLHKEVCYHSALALTEHLKEVERRYQARKTLESSIHEGDNAPYRQNTLNQSKPIKTGNYKI